MNKKETIKWFLFYLKCKMISNLFHLSLYFDIIKLIYIHHKLFLHGINLIPYSHLFYYILL